MAIFKKGKNLVSIILWNVHNRDLSQLVCNLAAHTEADVIVLNENSVPCTKILQELHQNVSTDFFIPRSYSEQRFHCFCRSQKLDMSEVHSGFRTSVRNLRIGHHHILLTLVHGIDMRNYDAEHRQQFAQNLSTDLQFVKDQQGTEEIVLLGDFNMNPFDRGMTLPAGLNAMMTRECIRQGVRRHLDKDYDFYYNPMWSLFGDLTDGPAGTVYDTSSQGPYGWNMLDQVVIHHSIVSMFNGVKILTSAGEHSLMDAKGRPDSKNASDHFPILLNLTENKQ